MATTQFICPKCKIVFTLMRTSEQKADLHCDKREWKKRCKDQSAVDGLAPLDCPEVYREVERHFPSRSMR
jgi:hypothetical protein